MIKILIATHGYLANGYKSSIEIIAGVESTKNISFINAYINEDNYIDGIELFFEDYNEENQYFIFTDLVGGSVNQKILPYKNNYTFNLISGINLPLVLEIAVMDSFITDEQLELIINSSRNSLTKLDLTSNNESNSLSDFL